MTELVQLSSAEQECLAKHEETISGGLRDFIRVGLALKEIRDKRLYRAEFDAFADYVEQRWDLGKSQAYRKISAAELATQMSPMGDILNERQARALLDLEPDQREKVFLKAKEISEESGKPLTSATFLKFVKGPEKKTIRFIDLTRVGKRAIAVIWSVCPYLLSDIAGSQAELASHLGMSKQAFQTYIQQFRDAFPDFESQAFRSRESRERMRNATKQNHQEANEAFQLGLESDPTDSNPFKTGSRLHKKWEQGRSSATQAVLS